MRDGQQYGISRNSAASLHMMSGYEQQEDANVSSLPYDPTSGSFLDGNPKNQYVLRGIHNYSTSDTQVTMTLDTGASVKYLIKSGVTQHIYSNVTSITVVSGGVTTLTLMYQDNLVVKNASPSRKF